MSYTTNNNQKKTDGKVLLVEDENLIGWSIATALRREGYAVILVESGEEAIKIISSTKFDIVITDLKLPQINGFEVATVVKSQCSSIPVIMISAQSEQTAQGVKVHQAVDRYIEKPFDLNEIIEITHRLISRSSAKVVR